jgi:mannose-6-phosphate isomerase class I
MQRPETWRKSEQVVLPAEVRPPSEGCYNIYPGFPVGSRSIQRGYDSLAIQLLRHRRVTVDGYGGVFWENFRAQLDAALQRLGVQTAWVNVEQALRPDAEIARLAEPFLGGDDPLFGTRFRGTLADFFVADKLTQLRPDPHAALSIVYGCGAALAAWDGALVYVDLPKNEIQYRARMGSIRNLGARSHSEPKALYKRFYFVDWIALNQHKAALLPRMDWIVDEQRPDDPTWMPGPELRLTLAAMSRNVVRVRPWFEPGPWGGQWMKDRFPGLSTSAPNYAWSFELIAPENGFILEGNGLRLEVSFDFLMFHDAGAVLGDSAERFGCEFPIRFDYLDTFDGGNLSVQCHPRPAYIRERFGERFTQDETYYIFDCKPGAQVYLGFQDGTVPNEFRRELECSSRDGTAVAMDSFVQRHPSNRHDLFLIPNGTVHCSGAHNLVLEISATPYIFTFKMYDWMRLDLEGRPRPLNIARAFENLRFDRAGRSVAEELISRPRVIAQGDGWQLEHLPTHAEHFYDVHRFKIREAVDVSTNGSCHVLNVVEGDGVVVETSDGMQRQFHFAETFVIPAAARNYRLVSASKQPVKVVEAFLKPGL